MSLRTFAPEALRDFQKTASIVPSSRYLARAMLAPLPLSTARCVVEFGPGTCAMTRELLSALPRRATLLCFEVNPRFCEYIRENLSDPRLELIQGSAERLPQELAARGLGPVEAAVSSLGLTLMARQEREAVLGGLASSLAVAGVFTQFQYLHALLPQVRPHKGNLERFTAVRFLRRYFNHVNSEVVWRNLPPAFVLSCRR